MRSFIKPAAIYQVLLSIFLTGAPLYSHAGNSCEQLFASSKTTTQKVVVEKPKTYRLFVKDTPVKDYHDLLNNLKPNDKIDLGHGDVFTFYGYLSDPSRGQLTTVLDIGDGKALRLAKFYHRSEYRNAKMMEKDMNDWFKLMDELDRNGVPVVKVYRGKSRPPAFIVVKKENFQFRLADLFVNGQFNLKNPELKNVDPRAIQVALEKLVDFAAKTWMYENIGDFRYEQMGFNGQDWILFDVGVRNTVLGNFNDETNAFSFHSRDLNSGTSTGNFLPEKIRQTITKKIVDIRRNTSQQETWITRETSSVSTGYSNYLFEGIEREPLETGRMFKVKSGDPREEYEGQYSIKNSWVENKVKFKIISFLKRGDRISTYQVQLEDGSKATLKVLQMNSEVDLQQLKEKVEKLKKEKNLIGYGDDFIIMKKGS